MVPRAVYPAGIATMTRRRLVLLALPVALVLLGTGAWIVWPRQPRTAITPENAAKIQKSMTLAEVEAILDGPARDETHGVGYFRIPPLCDLGVERREWIGPDCSIRVVLLDNQVFHLMEDETYYSAESALQRIRRWLHL
jgi:hypothetical protein